MLRLIKQIQINNCSDKKIKIDSDKTKDKTSLSIGNIKLCYIILSVSKLNENRSMNKKIKKKISNKSESIVDLISRIK